MYFSSAVSKKLQFGNLLWAPYTSGGGAEIINVSIRGTSCPGTTETDKATISGNQ